MSLYDILCAKITKGIVSLMDGDSSDDNTAQMSINIKSVYKVYPLRECVQTGCAFLCHKKLRM